MFFRAVQRGLDEFWSLKDGGCASHKHWKCATGLRARTRRRLTFYVIEYTVIEPGDVPVANSSAEIVQLRSVSKRAKTCRIFSVRGAADFQIEAVSNHSASLKQSKNI